jgi:hypothetical protein
VAPKQPFTSWPIKQTAVELPNRPPPKHRGQCLVRMDTTPVPADPNNCLVFASRTGSCFAAASLRGLNGGQARSETEVRGASHHDRQLPTWTRLRRATQSPSRRWVEASEGQAMRVVAFNQSYRVGSCRQWLCQYRTNEDWGRYLLLIQD